MPTIYQRVLNERFTLLHPALRQFLAEERGGQAAGIMKVTRVTGRLRNLVASGLGIPPAGEYEVQLEVSPRGDAQRWVRRFNNRYTLATGQRESRGLLVESSGPASLGFELNVREGALHFEPRRAWVLGIPLPLCLAPRISAENGPGGDEGWFVRVRISVPLLGQVADYAGDVVAVEIDGHNAG